jgi:ATP-binding cassette subfamily F protein 3
MLLRPTNLLLLDEPTNHLDIPAKQTLEQALLGYGGAVLLVCHDRSFISRVANRIVELRDGELILYRGDYAYYTERKHLERQQALEQEQERQRQARREASKRKRREKEAARRQRTHNFTEA